MPETQRNRPPLHKRVLLINPKLQIGYGIAVAWIIIVSVILTTLTVYYTVTDIAYIPVTHENYVQAVEQVHEALLWRVGAGMALLVATGIFLTVFFLHRICGPVYRFQRILQAAAEGHIPDNLNLRKNDEFKHLADSLVNTLHATRVAGIEVGKKTAAMEALAAPEGGFPDESDPVDDDSANDGNEETNGEEVSDAVTSR